MTESEKAIETTKGGYSDQELLDQIRRIKRHGFGEVLIEISKGQIQRMVVSESWKKTKST